MANDLATNGETYVQACVLAAAGGGPTTVFDVGANQGEWTRALLRQARTFAPMELRVFMFEPVGQTFERLRANFSGSEDGVHIRTFQLALSDREGEDEMVVLSAAGGTNSLHFDAALAAKAQDRVRVRKTTVGSFCEAEGIARIQLLKCDKEGHDANVLSGAKTMLHEERIDVLQFEYNHRWVYAQRYLKDVFDLVDGLPYRLARLAPHHIEVFECWHFELERFFEANYLIVHDRALSWFDAQMGQFDEWNTYG